MFFPEMYKKGQSFRLVTGTVVLGCQVKGRSWVSGGTPAIRTLTTALGCWAQFKHASGRTLTGFGPFSPPIGLRSKSRNNESRILHCVDRRSRKTPGGCDVTNGSGKNRGTYCRI